MSKEMKEEIKMFLIYMDLIINSHEQTLNSEGYMAVATINSKYPQFSKRMREVQKIMEEIDKL